MGKHHINIQDNVALDDLIDEITEYMYEEFHETEDSAYLRATGFFRMSDALKSANARLELRDLRREDILATQQGRTPDYSQILRRV